MSSRQILLQLFSALLMLAIINICIMQLAKETNPRQLIKAANISEPATVIFLGNSTMAAGINTVLFRELAGGLPLNLSLGATTPVEHLQLYLHNPKHHEASVYYGFFDTTLTDHPSGNFDSLTGNRAMSFYVEPEVAIRHYSANNRIEAAKLNIGRQFPIIVERGAIWAKVEVIRRRIGGIGMPDTETNQFGRSSDFALIEQDERTFDSIVNKALTTKAGLSPPVAELLEKIRSKGKKITFIDMPMTSSHRKKYYSMTNWLRYHEYIEAIVRSAGGSYLDASDWIPDVGFSDAIHMNTIGSTLFTEQLARHHLESK